MNKCEINDLIDSFRQRGDGEGEGWLGNSCRRTRWGEDGVNEKGKGGGMIGERGEIFGGSERGRRRR